MRGGVFKWESDEMKRKCDLCHLREGVYIIEISLGVLVVCEECIEE